MVRSRCADSYSTQYRFHLIIEYYYCLYINGQIAAAGLAHPCRLRLLGPPQLSVSVAPLLLRHIDNYKNAKRGTCNSGLGIPVHHHGDRPHHRRSHLHLDTDSEPQEVKGHYHDRVHYL